MCGLLPDIGNSDPFDEIGDFLIRDRSGAGADDEATQSLRPPGRIIECGETAASDADQMKPIEREMIDQCVEIAGDAAGLRTGGRIGRAVSPTAPIEGNDAVSGPRKSDDLLLPNYAGAGVGMQQDDRHTGSAAVDKPQLHAGQMRVHTAKRRELTVLHCC